jgi:hypothetical protein
LGEVLLTAWLALVALPASAHGQARVDLPAFRPSLDAPPSPARPLNRVSPLLPTGVSMMGPGERSVTRVRVLNVAYTLSCQDTVTTLELTDLGREVAQADTFYFRNSRLNLDLETVNVVIDRLLAADQFWLIASPGGYWLPPWPVDGTHSVEQDLYDLGYQNGDVAGVFVYYAWDNTPDMYAALGGGTYGVGSILGSAAYSSVPLCWDPATNDGYFVHEFLHQVDSMLEACGYPEFPHADQPYAYAGDFDDGTSFNSWILSSWLDVKWAALALPWGSHPSVTDTDGDRLPDADAALPLTEQSLHGDPQAADTDADGWNDGREAWAGFLVSSDLNESDTDGDGLRDGADLYPIDAVQAYVHEGSPVLDGVISPGEWDTAISYPGSPDLSAVFYTRCSSSYLFFAVHVHDDNVQTPWGEPWWDDGLYLRLDATNDGFLGQGQDNYDLWAAPFGADGRPTFAVSITMPDGSHNEDLVLENELIGSYVRSATEYTIELGIPANGSTGLALSPQSVVGLMAEVADFDTYPGWPRTPFFSRFIDFTLRPLPSAIAPAALWTSADNIRVWPQPARTGFTVQLQLERPALVRLGLYNAAGRRVATVDGGARGAGAASLSWPEIPDASGVYYLRMEGDGSAISGSTPVTVVR